LISCVSRAFDVRLDRIPAMLCDFFCALESLRRGLRPLSAPPDKESECNDQESDNQHPNLPTDSKKAKFPNEKLHRFRPFIVQAEIFPP
jgi:hypothetical protein